MMFVCGLACGLIAWPIAALLLKRFATASKNTLNSVVDMGEHVVIVTQKGH